MRYAVSACGRVAGVRRRGHRRPGARHRPERRDVRLVYAVGFSGRAFPDAGRVVQLYSSRASDHDSYRQFSFPAYQQLAGHDGFSGVLAHNPALVGVGEGGESRRTFGVLVSRNYFDVLGVPVAMAGASPRRKASRARTCRWWSSPRLLAAARLRPGTGRIDGADQRAAVHRRRHHAARIHGDDDGVRPRVVLSARRLPLDRQRLRRARRPGGSSPPTPTTCSSSPGWRRASTAVAAAARLPRGRRRPRPRRCQPRIATPGSRWRRCRASAPARRPSTSRRSALVGVVMLGLTAAVLLTVCLNLAAMLLARGRARRKELAIRMALGCGRARLVRQLLVEGLSAVAGRRSDRGAAWRRGASRRCSARSRRCCRSRSSSTGCARRWSSRRQSASA